jgi:sugar transferase (PEP-CTERM/EpsH1 system associated)
MSASMQDLLFLTHRIPYPPEKGDKIRSWHILRHLAQKNRVHLGCFYDDPNDAQYVPVLRDLCASVCCRPLNPLRAKIRSLAGFLNGESLSVRYFRDHQLAQWVNNVLRTHKPARIFVFCSAMAPYAANDRSSIRVLDMVDIDSEKWRQYAAVATWPTRMIFAREQRTLLALERQMAAAFDTTLLVSEEEAEHFKSLAPECAARIRSMHNGIDFTFFDPVRAYLDPFPGGGPTVVFTGAMDYRPNIEAVQWFTAEVFPILRRQTPDAEFWIVGSNPTQAVQRLRRHPGVEVTGRVADIRPYLAHASVVVAPLQIARGLQNKILEAMAMAKPVVATPEAREGIAAVSGEEILIASSPAEFAHCVAASIGAGGELIGRRARAYVERNFQWNFSILDNAFRRHERASAAAN